jgi:hypothetical protein
VNTARTLDLSNTIRRSIEEGLSILGPEAAKATLYHLEQIIDLEAATKDPRLLVEGIYKLFGAGGRIIEERIVEVLRQELGLSEEMAGKSLVGLVNQLQE